MIFMSTIALSSKISQGCSVFKISAHSRRLGSTDSTQRDVTTSLLAGLLCCLHGWQTAFGDDSLCTVPFAVLFYSSPSY